MAGIDRDLGALLGSKKKASRSTELLKLAGLIQKELLPVVQSAIDDVERLVGLEQRAQRISLFPIVIERCFTELVELRNRVSHRVEPRSLIATVGYVEAAIALRDFVAAARWWEMEKPRINYKLDKRRIIQETIKRSKDYLGDK